MGKTAVVAPPNGADTDAPSAKENVSPSTETTTAEAPKPAEPPPPHAIVTQVQFDKARNSGVWEHENSSMALWLNSAFPAKGRDVTELRTDLESHGIEIA